MEMLWGGECVDTAWRHSRGRLSAVVVVGLVLAYVLPSALQAQPAPVTVPRSDALTLRSEVLGGVYDVFVRLPPGYGTAANASRTYPVLYVTDASYNFQLAAAVTQLPMNAGTIEPFILVGIGYERGVDPIDSRVRDYTPSRDPEFARETGGAEAYLSFVTDELIPFVESRYRVDPGRRGLAGHSLGGLFAVYTLFQRPEIFSRYIVVSPSLWFDSGRIYELEAEYAATHDDLDADVYMSIGSLEHPDRPGEPRPANHMVNQLRDLGAALERRGYPGLRLRLAVVDGADHEGVVATAIMNGILWHFVRDRTIPFGY